MIIETEALIRLAEERGFETTVVDQRESSAVNLTPHLDDLFDNQFSVYVFAPPRNEADRYSPFNSKRDNANRAIERNATMLRAAARLLDHAGLMFIYGLPRDLMRYATALADKLIFRYWIAVSTATEQKARGLRPEHTGLLVMSRPAAALNRIRVPHAECRACARPLKDWGGKSHLMHPEGVALSDVWTDIVVDSHSRMPREIFERILRLAESPQRRRLLLVAPEGEPSVQVEMFEPREGFVAFNPLKLKQSRNASARVIPSELIDKLHNAPCLDALKRIPSETVDLAFADPPFNLTKRYNGYADDRAESDYLGWCKRWLIEYERVLKPGGAMFIINLPKWAAWLGDFLSRRKNLYIQSWIVWSSLPEPKGVLMPAHYALLYVTKGPEASRLNYCSMENGWEPFDEAVFPPDRADVCRRRSCIRKRRSSASTWRGELTDIWHDIHRVRQPIKHATNKTTHPCATPEGLIDRIIRLATNAGDVVLDAFAGTGTTAMVARRLGRRFIAIEQNDEYIRAAHDRVKEPRSLRGAIKGARCGRASKRELQLELKRLAMFLGRLPTKADAELLSSYNLESFETAFRSWGEALKAARMISADGFDGEIALPDSSRWDKGDWQESMVEHIASDSREM